jgi:hypothetical protein
LICGSVECDVLEFNAGDELVDSGKKQIVWNMITVAVLTHGERLGIAAKEIGVDRWWAIVDDCKDTGGRIMATTIGTVGSNGMTISDPADQNLIKSTAMSTVTLSPSGGTSPYTFSVYSGTLPAGPEPLEVLTGRSQAHRQPRRVPPMFGF